MTEATGKDDAAELNRAVRREQARLGCAWPALWPVEPVAAAIVAFGATLSYPTWPIVAWLVLVVAVAVLRALAASAYRRGGRPNATAERWYRRQVTAAFIAGLLWGAAGAAGAAVPGQAGLALAGLALIGGAASAFVIPARAPWAVYAFVAPAFAPAAILLVERGAALAIGLGLLALVAAMALALSSRAAARELADEMRRRAEAAAELTRTAAARDAAEAASRGKSSFVANLSHELRTPLNAIIGFSDMMLAEIYGPMSSPEYAAYSRYIHESAQHLLQLIEQILDLSKAEAGALSLDEGEVEPGSVIETCLRMVAESAKNAGVAVEHVLPETLPRLYADAAKLRQILLNLLSNAIKFTPSGGMVRLELGQDGDGALWIAVTDTGIGMRAEDLPRALAPFVQLDNARGRRAQGAGLGLPLAKRLIELHGGTLEISSALGAGTRVLARFPPSRTLHAARG